MIRAFIFIVVVTAFAYGAYWLIEQPGQIAMTFHGAHYSTSLGVGLIGLAALALVISLIWGLLRFILRLPSLVSLTTQAHRRKKGMMTLSRGMVAAGAGDAKRARQASDDLARLMPNEPMTLLLQAQSAQMAGDRKGAEAAFTQMLESPETRLLGLRGLHIEAKRRGDNAASAQFAHQAHQIAALPWASQAVIEHHIGQSDWQAALASLEESARHKTLDKATANRQRAVLQTAIALEKNQTDPEQALQLARSALKNAPGLVPAAALAGRLLARRGDLRRASKLLENAWIEGPHPDIARVYLDVRPGDSTSDRLTRAKSLARLKPSDPESLLTVARAAIDARDFATARTNLSELERQYQEQPPTVRFCLMMAELEDKEFGHVGAVREWLARASRARRDPTWIADGVTSDVWAPVSPVTGALDAFVWASSVQQLGKATAPASAWDPAGTPLAPPAATLALSAEPMASEAMVAHVPEAPTAPTMAPPVATAPPSAPDAAAKDVPPAPAKAVEPGETSRAISAPVIFARPLAPDDPGEADKPEELDENADAAPKRFRFLSRH